MSHYSRPFQLRSYGTKTSPHKGYFFTTPNKFEQQRNVTDKPLTAMTALVARGSVIGLGILRVMMSRKVLGFIQIASAIGLGYAIQQDDEADMISRSKRET